MHLYLIDGYGFVFRAFHSLPPLSSPEGTPVSAVYGFTNMIAKIIENHKFDAIAVALDNGGKTHRHGIFDQYKANRLEPDKELKVQFPIIREAVSALNLIALEEQGFEADDLLATYAINAANQGAKVTIVASDKDLMQLLVHENIELYDPIKNRLITKEDVYKKFGVFPDKLTDALALIGDVSDNIPGVKGIGPKTAAGLLEKFGSLENIYTSINLIESSRTQELLRVNRENAMLSKRLISLYSDAPIRFALDGLKVLKPDPNILSPFLSKYGFRSLQHRLIPGEIQAVESKNTKTDFTDIKAIKDLESLACNLEKSKFLAIHEEKEIITISSDVSSYSIVISENSIGGIFAEHEPPLTFEKIILTFKRVLESESVLKILLNSKQFLKRIAIIGVRLEAFDDLSIMAYSLETGKSGYGFYEISERYLGKPAKENSANMLLLYKELANKIHLSKKHALYELVEKPMVKILASMEQKGIKLDTNILYDLNLEFGQKARELAEKIYQEANLEFNVGSPKQLGEVLFDKLGIPGGKKTSKTGAYVTDSSTLEQLSDQGYEIAELVTKWRHFTKLANTYTSALPRSVNPTTGRVHTTFEMTATSTGRLSSNSPNLQNIPIRTKEGKKIRRAFIAEKGFSFISADYSQIELRLLAHVADIKELKEAFTSGQDIHKVTASQIFGVPLEEVTEELRYRSKGINFGIIYGISPFGLARNIGIGKQEAALYIDEYFRKYPGIKEYMQRTIEFAKHHGFVQTIFGRNCYITGINDKNFAVRSFAERAAINAPLQGSQADIIKKAMANIPLEIRQMLVLQIHDELLFEVPDEKIQIAKDVIQKCMEEVVKLSLPIKVEVSIAKHW